MTPQVVGITLCSGGEPELDSLLMALEGEMRPPYVVIGGPGARYYRPPPVTALLVKILPGDLQRDELLRLVSEATGKARHLPMAGFPRRARDYAKLALEKGLSLSVSASRGCGWSGCSFCFETVEARARGQRRVARPAQQVIGEVESLVERFGISHLTFTDTDFLGGGRLGVERALQIARGIHAAGICSWMIDIRPDEVNPDLLEELVGLGLRSVFVGIETVDESTYRYYEKPLPRRGLKKTFAVLEALGIHAIPGFILFDPRKSFEATIRDERWLREAKHFDLSRRLTRLASRERVPGAGYDPRLQALYDGMGMIFNQCYAWTSRILGDSSLKKRLMPSLAQRIRDTFENATDNLIRVVQHLQDPGDVEARRSAFRTKVVSLIEAEFHHAA
ncbi:MAG: radical SAM protein [Proteobacteria bacterium]|nr:radical SAM protein [Pseudomonadota bacterium]